MTANQRSTQMFVRSQSWVRYVVAERRKALVQARDGERGAGVLEALLWLSLIVAALAIVGPIVIGLFTDAAEDLPENYNGVTGN